MIRMVPEECGVFFSPLAGGSGSCDLEQSAGVDGGMVEAYKPSVT